MDAPLAATPTPVRRAFAHQAARGSWIAPFVGAFLGTFVRRSFGAGVYDLVMVLFVLSGIALGVIGIAGIPRYGRKGILAPAIIGLTLNGLLVTIFVSNFFATASRR